MLAHLLLGQLDALVRFAGYHPVPAHGLDPNLALDQRDYALLAGQVKPYFARARLISVVEPEVVIARQGEILADLPKCDRLGRSAHDEAIELLARFGVLGHEVVDLGDCLRHFG